MDKDSKRAEAFGDLLLAGMKDAAINFKMTQLKAEITPEGKTKPIQVRIIIVPEKMEHEFPKGIGG